MIGMRSTPTLASVLALLLSAGLSAQAELGWKLNLANGGFDRPEGPVSLQLSSGREIPTEFYSGLASGSRATLWSGGRQLEIELQVDLEEGSLEVHWIHPAMGADSKQRLELRLSPMTLESAATGEAKDTDAGGRDLRVGDRRVLRYVYGFDPERREQTYKSFHHVYDFAGDEFLTKGPGGTFSHHRGLFLGFNQMQQGERKMDFWHCHEGLRIEHQRFVAGVEGGLTSSSAALISWIDGEGEQIVEELRQVRAWKVSDSRRILDFEIRLSAMAGELELAGDAQHAGFQFRAREAPEGEPELKVTYLRPEAGEEQGNDVWLGCDWVAGLFEQDGRNYAVVHMDASSNPRPNRYSTREYGRFGSTFDAKLAADPLVLRYRILIIDVDAEGPLQVDRLIRDYRAYTEVLRPELVPG